MIRTDEEANIRNQDKRFKALRNIVGDKMATFCCCAVFNVAYYTDIDAKDWYEYIEKIKRRETIVTKFTDGITDIRTVVRVTLDDQERWEAEWGIGSTDKPYTGDDYRRLDEIFSTLSSRLERMGGMDTQQDFVLHNCSKMQLLLEKFLAKGSKDDIDKASKLSAMIQKDLEAEQLRKKDSLPIEEIKLDGIVDALRRRYGVSAEMTKDEVMNMLSKWMTGHHYAMTMDAAEHALMSIINMMRRNNDEPELDELPKQVRFDPKMAGEFADEQADWEKEAYEYLGLKKFSWNEPYEAYDAKEDISTKDR